MNIFIQKSVNRLLQVNYVNSRLVISKTRLPFTYICRDSHQESKNFKTVKRYKKLFSTVLFGSTLATALYFKRRKQSQLQDTYKDCELLKLDEHYAKPNMFYRYKGFVLPDFVIKELKTIDSFEVNENDIFVISFPKTGTTWVQEIVYLIATNLDFDSAKNVGIETRFPYLEFIYPGIKHVQKMDPPRFIKSHLPYTLLPIDIQTKKPKLIYVMRNPKDTLVSFYYFVSSLTATNYSGSFKDFFDSFLSNKIPYGPLDKHFTEFWDLRNQENVLIITYEDLHKDLPGSIIKISNFLGYNLSEDDVNHISNHCQFSKMATNNSVNYTYWEDLGIRKKNSEPFMRKGIVGDWINYFDPEMNSKMNDWIENNITPSGITFVYSLEDCKK